MPRPARIAARTGFHVVGLECGGDLDGVRAPVAAERPAAFVCERGEQDAIVAREVLGASARAALAR